MKDLTEKLIQNHNRHELRQVVSCQVKRIGHRRTQPCRMLMLTHKRKDSRVQWTVQYKDVDQSRTILTEKICYQYLEAITNKFRRIGQISARRMEQNRLGRSKASVQSEKTSMFRSDQVEGREYQILTVILLHLAIYLICVYT